MTIKEACKECKESSIKNGFEGLDVYKQLAWLNSEVGEAFNDWRKSKMEEFHFELADVAIILFDLCGKLDIDLEYYIETKLAINSTRPKRHGDIN
jgi:NTP pyrophosphatase (non-canonical NTP hydrolase)